MEAVVIFFLGAVVAGVLHRRVARLEREVAELRELSELRREAPAEAATAPPEPRRTARIVGTPAVAIEATPEPVPVSLSEPIPEPQRARFDFETLVGGKLPIWIGGIALILAGFFLVRLSIESGWLGPGIRTLLAAAFAALLVAASEVARRHPLTRDDPRIGQVLAGAGVASAYGTLYIAAAQYQLIGAVAAFALMVAVTAAALFLALRHGPPTAIMALIGGFAAPLVAGYDAAGIGPLLGYLALFIAALFLLAARRRWRWLAIAAVVAGFGWANLLLALLRPDDLGAVAAFVVVLAIGATLALPRTGEARGWLRAAPLVAGLVQLLALSPQLEFGATAWTFYLILSAAALLLAWRDAVLLPGALAAAIVVAVLLLMGCAADAPGGATGIAAIVAAALFGGVGALLSRRDPRWAVIALLGIAGPVLATRVGAPARFGGAGWAVLALVAAIAAGALAWRHRDRGDTGDSGLIGGSFVAAALFVVGLGDAAGPGWTGAALALAMVALVLWAARLRDRHVALLPAAAFGVAIVVAAPVLTQLARAAGLVLAGETLVYRYLPPVGWVVRTLALPSVAALALVAWRSGGFGAARRWVAPAALALVVIAAYVVAKQPLAIADPARFLALGFGERAAITAALLAVGWALTRRDTTARAGRILAAVAVARFVLLDLLIFNPALVAQAVGRAPVGNLAVALPAVLALAATTIAADRRWRVVALAATVVAALAVIRQLTHGTILTGSVGNGENWGYSAVLLALATLWLWRGIARGTHDLRLAGLALLTLVTLKVFLVDVAALGGVLRILSFLGLGVALIAIGWAYGRVMRAGASVPATG